MMVLNEGSYSTLDGIFMGSRVILLGVLWGGPQHLADGTLEVVEIPTKQVPIARTNIPVHLGYYIKARELLVLKEHLFATLNIK